MRVLSGVAILASKCDCSIALSFQDVMFFMPFQIFKKKLDIEKSLNFFDFSKFELKIFNEKSLQILKLLTLSEYSYLISKMQTSFPM